MHAFVCTHMCACICINRMHVCSCARKCAHATTHHPHTHPSTHFAHMRTCKHVRRCGGSGAANRSHWTLWRDTQRPSVRGDRLPSYIRGQAYTNGYPLVLPAPTRRYYLSPKHHRSSMSSRQRSPTSIHTAPAPASAHLPAHAFSMHAPTHPCAPAPASPPLPTHPHLPSCPRMHVCLYVRVYMCVFPYTHPFRTCMCFRMCISESVFICI